MKSIQFLGALSLLSSTQAATFTSCSDEQVATLQTAIDRATERSFAVIRHLEENPNGSEVQTTWYGEFSSERYNKILTAFEVRHTTLNLLQHKAKQ